MKKSKELIEEYINECNNYGYVEYEGELWKPELELIHKDLEILEIIKQNASGEYDTKNKKSSILFRIDDTNDYKIIKEWLENDIH